MRLVVSSPRQLADSLGRLPGSARSAKANAEMGVSTRAILGAFGGLLALAGLVWFLQGVGVLPGSFTTGQTP